MEYSEGLLSDLEGLLKEYSPSGSGRVDFGVCKGCNSRLC